MAQRLVRAKRKITSAGIPFAIPDADELAPRLDDVLTVIYLSYNAGYLEPSASGRELSDDAIWLAELVARALPHQAEAWGLLALLTFLSSRTQSRFDDQGRLVLLEDQDRAVGRGGDQSGRRLSGHRGGTASAGSVPAAGGDCRLSCQRHLMGRDGLAADPDPLRHVAALRHISGDPAQPCDRARPCPRSGGRAH